jgi:hypothetical protein
MACRADIPLRFKVGDEVEANVGKFKRGTVIKQWDRDNAYRIELDDRKRTNIWAPIDHDTYVRAPRA